MLGWPTVFAELGALTPVGMQGFGNGVRNMRMADSQDERHRHDYRGGGVTERWGAMRAFRLHQGIF